MKTIAAKGLGLNGGTFFLLEQINTIIYSLTVCLGDTNSLVETHGIYKRNFKDLLSEPWSSNSVEARDIGGACDALI
jgi:hypothetical protein